MPPTRQWYNGLGVYWIGCETGSTCGIARLCYTHTGSHLFFSQKAVAEHNTCNSQSASRLTQAVMLHVHGHASCFTT